MLRHCQGFLHLSQRTTSTCCTHRAVLRLDVASSSSVAFLSGSSNGITSTSAASSTSISPNSHKSSSILSNTSSIMKRWYTPMTSEEQEKEKARIHHLSPEQKEEELRKLNREISKLEMLRGINTGELYTWSGRYKSLMRDYGVPLFVYYWTLWSTMGLTCYAAVELGGLDAMDLIGRVDDLTGFQLANKVDPQLGKIGLVLVVNEMLEPIRLPIVVATLKPVMDTINPPKY